MDDVSGGEIDLDDGLSNGIQDAFFALPHPLPQLREINLLDWLLFLFEIVLEDDSEVLEIREDVVESMTDH